MTRRRRRLVRDRGADRPRATASDQGVHALAGYQPADGGDQDLVGTDAVGGSDPGPALSGVEGTEALGVDAGWDHHGWERADRRSARLRPGRSGRPRPPATPRRGSGPSDDRRTSGRRAGIVTSAPWSIDPVGAPKGRADDPEGQGGVEQDQLGLVPGRPGDLTRSTSQGQGPSQGSGDRSIGNGWARIEGRACPDRGWCGRWPRRLGEPPPQLPQVVLDAPILGGKSLVTSRCLRIGDLSGAGGGLERPAVDRKAGGDRPSPLGPDLGVGVVGQSGRELPEPGPTREPSRRAAQRAWGPEEGAGLAQVAGEEVDDPRVVRGGDVAEDDQGRAPDVVEVAVGDVPATVPGLDLVVGGGQQPVEVDQDLGRLGPAGRLDRLAGSA